MEVLTAHPPSPGYSENHECAARSDQWQLQHTGSVISLLTGCTIIHLHTWMFFNYTHYFTFTSIQTWSPPNNNTSIKKSASFALQAGVALHSFKNDSRAIFDHLTSTELCWNDKSNEFKWHAPQQIISWSKVFQRHQRFSDCLNQWNMVVPSTWCLHHYRSRQAAYSNIR
jgi:hypothetical protein